jgi:hypothetical protein
LPVSVAQIIQHIEALPERERLRLVEYLRRLHNGSKTRRDAKDLAILNRRAARLNKEAEDVLDYQVAL